MAFKLSGTLPAQSIKINLPKYDKPDVCNGERTEYRGPYAGGEAHVVEYKDGSQDVYVNW